MVINIPTVQPNAPQFQPPDALVQGYLNRPNANMVASQGLGNAVSAFANYKQQQQAKQLEAIKAYAELYGAGGPKAVQSFAPTLNAFAGSNIIPQGNVAPAPNYTPSSGVGGGMPTSSSPAPSPTPAPIMDQSANPAISEHIMNSLPTGWDHQAYTPAQPTNFDSQLQGLQGQLASYNDQGKYGQTQQEGIARQVPIVTAQMNDARERQQFADRNAIEESRFQRGKTAEVVSKEGENISRTAQLRGLFNDLKNSVSTNQPSLTAGISGRVATATGGRLGNTSAANVQNVSAPLTAALNYELTKRFNESEANFLMNSLMPSPKDTPQFAKQKLDRLDRMITALESGNEQNIKNIAATVSKGTVPTTAPSKNQTTTVQSPAITSKAAYDALPNGATYTWNGKPHVKGRS